RLHVAVLLGSLFGRLVLETRFSRIPLANRRLQPSTTPGTLPAIRTAALPFEINAAIFNRFGYIENADLF
ncbi:hypothetical protein LGN32_23035, partial [Burkholderia contaminans]|uniref:hypothetical protein n=1 Tax=Burkholderia contaminans TaxID=488447 RepID=UPI001CF1B6C3